MTTGQRGHDCFWHRRAWSVVVVRQIKYPWQIICLLGFGNWIKTLTGSDTFYKLSACYTIVNTVTLWQNYHHFAEGVFFSNKFASMKTIALIKTSSVSLFLRVQLSMSQHGLRWWLGTEQVTSHYVNQRLLMHIYVTRPQWELTTQNALDAPVITHEGLRVGIFCEFKTFSNFVLLIEICYYGGLFS